MEESNSIKKFALPIAVVAIIAVAVIMVNSSNEQPATSEPGEAIVTETVVEQTQTGEYQDGEYSAQGAYTAPSGQELIDVTLTIENGVVTSSTFQGNAENPASVRFQGEFADNYTEVVVGKNIDEIQLDKVAGSSLTPNGFMDALNKIKAEAQV